MCVWILKKEKKEKKKKKKYFNLFYIYNYITVEDEGNGYWHGWDYIHPDEQKNVIETNNRDQ